jgi:hypothetical protein
MLFYSLRGELLTKLMPTSNMALRQNIIGKTILSDTRHSMKVIVLQTSQIGSLHNMSVWPTSFGILISWPNMK